MDCFGNVIVDRNLMVIVLKYGGVCMGIFFGEEEDWWSVLWILSMFYVVEDFDKSC